MLAGIHAGFPLFIGTNPDSEIFSADNDLFGAPDVHNRKSK